MHAELRQLDPATADRLKPGDSQRIQRALEVCLLTGSTLSALQAATRPPAAVEYLNIGLMPADRAALHARIEARFEAMLAAGFVAEVRALQALPEMSAAVPAMRAVGYRQIWRHVAGEADLASGQRRRRGRYPRAGQTAADLAAKMAGNAGCRLPCSRRQSGKPAKLSIHGSKLVHRPT